MIITFVTDFGYKDPHAGIFKGLLSSSFSQASIVEISNEISPYDIMEAYYIVSVSYKNFPKGSINLICVDSDLSRHKKLLLALIDGYYFILPDIGLLGLLEYNSNVEEVIEFPLEFNENHNFLNIYLDAVKSILNSKNKSLKEIAPMFFDYKKLKPLLPIINMNNIIGHVIYIDNYGNLVVNITKKIFEDLTKDKTELAVEINLKGIKSYGIYDSISSFLSKLSSYEESFDYEGELVAVFNSSGYLQINIFRSNKETVGGASSLLGMEVKDTVTLNLLT